LLKSSRLRPPSSLTVLATKELNSPLDCLTRGFCLVMAFSYI
jgi:hypothetical protein